jgi:PST family polysaccharide transporter
VAKTVGISNFGIINFSLSIMTYFSLIVNYGFDLQTTRAIAINKENPLILNQVINKTFSAKFYLLCFSTVVFIIAHLFIAEMAKYTYSDILAYLSLVGALLFPTWFYQGIGKVLNVSIFNFLAKVVTAIISMFWLKQASDYNSFLLINSISFILTGLIAFLIVIFIYKQKIRLVRILLVKDILKEAFPVFLSSAITSIYTTANTLLLGMMATVEDVSFFAVSSRIIAAIIAIMVMGMSQVLYPRMASSLNGDAENGLTKLYKIAKLVALVNLVLAIMIYFFSDFIIQIIYGEEYRISSESLRILSFLPLIIGLSNLFGIQAMLNLGMQRQFLLLIFGGSIISLSINLVFIPQFGFYASSYAWLLSEIFITITSFVIINRYKLKMKTCMTI